MSPQKESLRPRGTARTVLFALVLAGCCATATAAQQAGRNPASAKAAAPPKQDPRKELLNTKARIEQLEEELRFERGVADELMRRLLATPSASTPAAPLDPGRAGAPPPSAAPAPASPTAQPNPSASDTIAVVPAPTQTSPPAASPTPSPFTPVPAPPPGDQPAPSVGSSVRSDPPLPAPPVNRTADVHRRVREACGVMVPAAPDMSGAKDLILVSSQRRALVEQELQLPGARPTDLEAVDADVCFDILTPGYVLAMPPGTAGQITSVIPRLDSPLGRWLRAVAPRGTRVRLAPGAECNIVLDAVRERGAPSNAVWVEDDEGLSRCERDAAGNARVDPGKIDGYSGVIVLRIKRT